MKTKNVLFFVGAIGSWPEAFNEAVTNAAFKGGFVIQRHSHVPLVICSPEADWSSRDPEDVRRIRERGELVVGALAGNWGDDGDYTSDPPKGYFPELIESVHEELSKLHNLNVDLKYELFNSSDQMLADWKSGRVDLDFTDPSFLVSGLWQPEDDLDGTPAPRRARIADFQQGCPVVATPSTMIVPLDSPITTMAELNAQLLVHGGLLGVLSEGNRDLLFPWIPQHRVTVEILESIHDICQSVRSGRSTAAFVTGHVLCQDVETFTTGVLAVHTSFVLSLSSSSSAKQQAAVSAGLLFALAGLFL